MTVSRDTGVSPAKETASEASRADGVLPAFVSGGAYGMLALLGVVLGVVGSFTYAWALGPLPVAALALVVVNFGVPWLAGWGMGGKLGAAMPWVAWMVVVIPLSAGRAEGDLIIAGDTAGYLFLVGGMITGGLAIAATPSPTGPWLLGPGVRPPR